MSAFPTLAQAAEQFGYRSGPSFRKAFERGHLPKAYLIRVGQRGIRVDSERLTAWLRDQSAKQGGQAPGEVRS